MANIIQKKRLANEVLLLAKEPIHYTTAYPDASNPLIWYCLIVGQKGTPYYKGHYIYKVVHSPKYPAEPPDYYFLTPCGRYKLDVKICLSNSGFHKGDWTSMWNIKAILISFYSIFIDDKEDGIAHITPKHTDAKQLDEERKKMAIESISYNTKHLNDIYSKFDFSHLKDEDPKSATTEKKEKK
jgi:ubiquitin-protein ligase